MIKLATCLIVIFNKIGVLTMRDQTKIEYLRKFDIFKQLKDYELEPMIDYIEIKKYPQETILFLQNEPITKVFFLINGQVKVFRTNFDGKEQIVNLLQARDMFPHQGFFRHSKYPANAEVIEDAQLITMNITDFEQFILIYPTVSEKIYRMLGELISDLQNRLEAKILFTAHEQIIMQLMRLTKIHGQPISDAEYKIMINFTNQELANIIGTSRETVSRTLTLLRKDQLIRNDVDNLYIVNYQGLKQKFTE